MRTRSCTALQPAAQEATRPPPRTEARAVAPHYNLLRSKPSHVLLLCAHFLLSLIRAPVHSTAPLLVLLAHACRCDRLCLWSFIAITEWRMLCREFHSTISSALSFFKLALSFPIAINICRSRLCLFQEWSGCGLAINLVYSMYISVPLKRVTCAECSRRPGRPLKVA